MKYLQVILMIIPKTKQSQVYFPALHSTTVNTGTALIQGKYCSAICTNICCVKNIVKKCALAKLTVKCLQSQLHSLHSLVYNVYIVHTCTMCCVHCAMHTVKSTQYTVHCILCTLYCTMYTVNCAMYTANCVPCFTLDNINCKLHNVHFTQYNMHCTLHPVHCKLHTVHFTLHTIHIFISCLVSVALHCYPIFARILSANLTACFPSTALPPDALHPPPPPPPLLQCS